MNNNTEYYIVRQSLPIDENGNPVCDADSDVHLNNWLVTTLDKAKARIKDIAGDKGVVNESGTEVVVKDNGVVTKYFTEVFRDGKYTRV